jgi:coproporphyrinogen III oxidase-like Fe-S oxidoreductase
MYALPNQSIEQALSDLKIAIDLKPEHLSWYQLTLEPNTAFHHSPPKNMADDDLLADISEAGLSFLAEKNYQRYEVSAFNLSGKYPSWHNTNYWQFGDYLGIGAGAHGKITRADTQQIIRTSKKRNPKDYLNPQKSYVDNQKILQTQELPIEFMLNAMRLKDGFEQSLFSKTTGLLNAHLQPVLNELEQKGLLDLSNNRIKPTAIGFNFLNDILMAFSPESFPKLSNQNRIEITELN